MGEVIVAIDIGSSKVCTVIGLINRSNGVDILGMGLDPCSGVKKGIIIDIDATSKAIKNSVAKAEAMANLRVVSAFVNISAAHVDIVQNRNIMNISNENREITARDVEKLLYASMSVPISEDREVIDVIPKQYIIDGCDEIMDPIGMVGIKFEADVDIVAGKITSVQNIVKSMERAGIKVDGFIVEGFATAEVSLTPEEKDMGVVLLDLGGGTTDISVFKNKKLQFYGSIPVGGDHITNDIAIGLKTPYSEAEKIKRQYELALLSLIKNDQDIAVTDLNDHKKRNVKVSEFVEIIEARVYETFSLVKEKLEKSGIDNSKYSGIILTGAGISYVDGNVELAGEVFGVSARVATIRLSEVMKCEYAAAAGIIKYVSGHSKGRNVGNVVKPLKAKEPAKRKSIFNKASEFFKGLFNLLS